MTEEEQTPYKQEAEAKKEEHKKKYPNYKFKPRRGQDNKRGQHDMQGAAQMFVGPSDPGPSTSSAAPMISTSPSFQAQEQGAEENIYAHNQSGFPLLVSFSVSFSKPHVSQAI